MATEPVDVRRQGGWLPESRNDLERWIKNIRQRVQGRDGALQLHPVVEDFKELIDTDPVIRVYLNQMIDQVPRAGDGYAQTVDELLLFINEILRIAPEFGQSQVTTPLARLFDSTMSTPAGFAAYSDARINAALKNIMTCWGEFLDSPDSRYVLNESPSGWKCAEAQRAIGIEQFQYEPDDEYWGFNSWNDFFTRRFKPGVRPVADPDDDAVVTSPCEAAPYRISTNAARQERFWIKSQPYSLCDMLANDAAVDALVGGTVYQAFLSATDYHRWHCPVSGTIVRAFVRPGTYYSEVHARGEEEAPTDVQSYLAHVATRAVIIIDADNPHIGVMAFVAIGMLDVSSCIIGEGITAGSHVAKGDELGFFQFGGSTCCLVFRPDVIADFSLAVLPQPHSAPVPVRSKLATVTAPL